MNPTDSYDPNELPGISSRLLGLGIAAVGALVVGMGTGALCVGLLGSWLWKLLTWWSGTRT